MPVTGTPKAPANRSPRSAARTRRSQFAAALAITRPSDLTTRSLAHSEATRHSPCSPSCLRSTSASKRMGDRRFGARVFRSRRAGNGGGRVSGAQTKRRKKAWGTGDMPRLLFFLLFFLRVPFSRLARPRDGLKPFDATAIWNGGRVSMWCRIARRTGQPAPNVNCPHTRVGLGRRSFAEFLYG